MKKIALLFCFALLFACFGQSKAFANAAEEAACTESGGEWFPFRAVPKCDCTKRQDLFSLLAPGSDQKLVSIRTRAKKTQDVCENRVMSKTSSNIAKAGNTVGQEKTVQPTKFVASLEPGDIQKPAKPDTTIDQHLNVTSGAAQIIQIRASCDNCTVNGTGYFADSQIRAPKGPWDYSVSLKPADANTGGSGKLTLHVVTKDGKDTSFEATVNWEPKVTPPPPHPLISPEKIACEASKGIWIAETGKCVCLNDLVEVKGKCEPKPAPLPAPVVKVESEGYMTHPHAKVVCGYADQTKGLCAFGLGLSIDMTSYLEWSASITLGRKGTLRLDANHNLVDKRFWSWFISSGLRLALADNGLGLEAGGFHQSDGNNGGGNSPVQTTVGGYLGPDIRVQGGWYSVELSLWLTLGSFQRGSEPSRFSPGFMSGLRFDFLGRKTPRKR